MTLNDDLSRNIPKGEGISKPTEAEQKFIDKVRRWYGIDPTDPKERYRTKSYLNPFSQDYDPQKVKDAKELDRLVKKYFAPYRKWP